MMLADGGDPSQIEAALKAGASTGLKDVKGRTALDYLNAANCDNSLIPRDIFEPVLGGPCNRFHKANLSRARHFLTR